MAMTVHVELFADQRWWVVTSEEALIDGPFDSYRAANAAAGAFTKASSS